MPSHYFHSHHKYFKQSVPVETTPRDDAEITAREMIRIFGPEAERMALSQMRKFAARGDEEAAQIWRKIGSAIDKARVRER